jgi:tRNA threonylcarbamoyladenosine biosynthesis protein TsaE
MISAVAPVSFIVYLEGDLGAGKTTLVRGFLRGLGYRGNVKSPTFTILEPYELGDRAVYHLDLYRLADPGELEYLGLRDLLAQDATLLIEWPEHGRGMLPDADITVNIGYRNEGRSLDIRSCSTKGERLLGSLCASLRDKVNK